MKQKNERKIKKNKEKRRKIIKPSFGVNKSFWQILLIDRYECFKS